MARRFYLVQRLAPAFRKDPSRGFDGLFRCEYMGSAEFEYGAIPESLARIRKVGATTTQVEVDGRTVYLVHKAGDATVGEDLIEWLTEPTRTGWLNSKDATYFDEILAGHRSEYVHTIAWWDVATDVLFTHDPEVAGRLMEAVAARPVSSRKSSRKSA